MGRRELPEGVEDAILNLTECAHAMAVSTTTFSEWMRHEDFPVLERGTNGRSYRFRLSEVWEWRRRRDAEEETKRAQAEAAAAQMRLHLIGETGGGERFAGMSPKQRREEIEAELRWMRLARERRELIPAEAVQAGIERILIAFRNGVANLPDRIGTDLGLSGRDQEKLEAACDAVLEEVERVIEAQDYEGDRTGRMI